MPKKRLIPSLLLREGRCVKGRQFGVDGFRDTGNPVTAARVYDAQGADELIFLDITASAEARATTIDVVHHVAEEVFMPLCVGGGIRTLDDIRALLQAGADKVSLNTGALERPQLVEEAARRFGNQAIVLSIDVRRVDGRPEVFGFAGTRPTGRDPVDWAREAVDLGAGEILITSVDREGTMSGYDVELTRSVADAVTVPVIAHGGCGTLQHLVEGIDEGHADAVSCASMLHFTDQSLIKARAHMKTYGVDVRIA
ncbi:MAG TPA: imidazole glycerol phosphate synthase cyclase subunit [Capillimicrobium sp.]|jgi:cyclase